MHCISCKVIPLQTYEYSALVYPGIVEMRGLWDTNVLKIEGFNPDIFLLCEGTLVSGDVDGENNYNCA